MSMGKGQGRGIVDDGNAFARFLTLIKSASLWYFQPTRTSIQIATLNTTPDTSTAHEHKTT